MKHSTSGLPGHHQLPEFTQTHVHWVSDVIQPSHPLSSPSPPALNLFQYQGLFKWVSSSHQVAKVLEFQLQNQSSQWTSILWLPDVNSWLIKTTWCWERLKAEEGDRRWRGWMASPMQWLWTWANSRRYWGKGKPCMLRSMELQRVGHNWATEHNNLVQTLS